MASICMDTFLLRVTGTGLNADITIPGSFPIRTTPGAGYFIGFTYITGEPAATGWHIGWVVVDDNGDLRDGATLPTVTISPEVPDTDGDAAKLRNGHVRGNVPSPTRNLQYNGLLTILQE